MAPFHSLSFHSWAQDRCVLWQWKMTFQKEQTLPVAHVGATLWAPSCVKPTVSLTAEIYQSLWTNNLRNICRSIWAVLSFNPVIFMRSKGEILVGNSISKLLGKRIHHAKNCPARHWIPMRNDDQQVCERKSRFPSSSFLFLSQLRRGWVSKGKSVLLTPVYPNFRGQGTG